MNKASATSGTINERLVEIAAIQPLGLFCDLDGTLAPIVSTPQAARVPLAALRLLKALAKSLDLLALVSGRPIAQARQMAPLRGITYVGNHGLELWQAGRSRLAPGAASWRRFMARVLREIAETPLPRGIVIEEKGLTLSIHYRLASDPEGARTQLLQAVARLPLASRVRITEGRRTVELHPNLPVNKGTAVEALSKGRHLRGAIYLGDDTTDLDAFRALQRLEKQGALQAITIAIRSAESPPELLKEAHYLVNDTSGTLAFLRALRAALSHRR